MKRPELALGAIVALFAAFVGAQIVGAPRHGGDAAPHYAATDDAPVAPDGDAAMAPVDEADPAVAAATRRRVVEQGYGTYIGEILALQDSALARWPDHAGAPIRVWIQPSSSVDGWTPQYPQYAMDGFLAWQQVGLPIRFAFVSDSASADAHLVWVEHVEAPRIGITRRVNDQHGWVMSGVISVATHGSDGRLLGETVVRTTALHEVGHLIGLNHTTDTTSIMAAQLSESHLLSASDKATALLLYDLPPGSVK